MNRMTRRRFMHRSASVALGTGVALAAPVPVRARPQGANDAIRVAVAGLNNQGANHIRWFGALDGVRVVALCDPDPAVLNREVEKLKAQNLSVRAEHDVRRLLESEDIDALVIAAPNHWHALMAVWACQAGKDVYVEKPVSHSIWEGRQIIRAAKKYGRIVQSGTQRRSDLGRAEAYDYIRSGALGPVTLIRGVTCSLREGIGRPEGPVAPPESVDFNLWTGPAAMAPLMRPSLHYDWHWFWNTGNGELGNNGIHAADLCCWAGDIQGLAPRTISVGGRFEFNDLAETPNTHIVYHDYGADQPPVLIEVRNLAMKRDVKAASEIMGLRFGCVVHCEGGYLAGGWAYDKDGKKIKQFKLDEGAEHKKNFIDAVRSRKAEALSAGIEKGHVASGLCHLGNISHRLGLIASPDETRERLADAPRAAEAYEQMVAHLEANGLSMNVTQATLGPWLEMDPEREVFTGLYADVANPFLKDSYRFPFIVPEEV